MAAHTRSEAWQSKLLFFFFVFFYFGWLANHPRTLAQSDLLANLSFPNMTEILHLAAFKEQRQRLSSAAAAAKVHLSKLWS